MTGITYSLDKCLVLEPGLGIAICRMSAVTAYAATGIRIHSLPLRQETVKVIVS